MFTGLQTPDSLSLRLVCMLIYRASFILYLFHINCGHLTNMNKKTYKTTKTQKTYSRGYSLVVTDPTTNPPITGLTRGERTGSRAFQCLWPYVEEVVLETHISLEMVIGLLLLLLKSARVLFAVDQSSTFYLNFFEWPCHFIALSVLG